MSSVSLMINTLFNHVFQLSLLASITLPFVLLIKRIFKNITGAHFQYLIWFVLIIRLVMPLTPESFFSMYNYIPMVNHVKYVDTVHNPAKNDIEGSMNNSNIDDTSIYSNTYSSIGNSNMSAVSNKKNEAFESSIKTLVICVSKVVPFIWILGVMLLSSIVMLFNIRFRKKVKKCSAITDSEILEEYYKCKIIVGFKKDVPLIRTYCVKNPAVLGAVNAKVLLPESKLRLLSKEELSYVFLHELEHIKRRDIFVNYVLAFVTLVYWFNPLIWYAFRKIKDDMELSCDSSVVSHISDSEITNYGDTIIKLAQISDSGLLMRGMASIVSKKSNIKRRLIMLNRFNRKTYRLTLVSIIVIIAFGATSLTGAKTFSSDSVQMHIDATSKSHLIVDKIDYPFINDSQLIGKWKVVDFVRDIEDFQPRSLYKVENYSLKSMTFAENGKMAIPLMEGYNFDDEVLSCSDSWTKGYIIDNRDKTASRYTIKAIDGNQYLFMEWKNGDYTALGMKPQYYVLKKTSSDIVTLKNRVENINYKFVNDDQAIGTWKSVDIVKEVQSFSPVYKNADEGQLLLKRLFIYQGGLLGEPDYATTPSNGENISSTNKWTKGYTVDFTTGIKTHYIIKTISGEKYMFYEWNKWYYVLKEL